VNRAITAAQDADEATKLTRHTGAGRCLWLTWVPAFAGMTRMGKPRSQGCREGVGFPDRLVQGFGEAALDHRPVTFARR
jgi:hypothetical protein